MPLRWFGVLALALLLLYGGLAYWLRESMLSPGHLLGGHADIHQACFSCHSAFRGIDAARCVACHRIADIGLRTVSGAPLLAGERVLFHQDLRNGFCAACHSDHAGPNADGTLEGFEHGLLAAYAVDRSSDSDRAEFLDRVERALARL